MNALERVNILLLLSRETLKSLETLPETEFFLQNSVSFLGFYVSEPIYVSLLFSYNRMSTEPSDLGSYNTITPIIAPMSHPNPLIGPGRLDPHNAKTGTLTRIPEVHRR